MCLCGKGSLLHIVQYTSHTINIDYWPSQGGYYALFIIIVYKGSNLPSEMKYKKIHVLFRYEQWLRIIICFDYSMDECFWTSQDEFWNGLYRVVNQSWSCSPVRGFKSFRKLCHARMLYSTGADSLMMQCMCVFLIHVRVVLVLQCLYNKWTFCRPD